MDWNMASSVAIVEDIEIYYRPKGVLSEDAQRDTQNYLEPKTFYSCVHSAFCFAAKAAIPSNKNVSFKT